MDIPPPGDATADINNLHSQTRINNKLRSYGFSNAKKSADARTSSGCFFNHLELAKLVN